MFVPGKFCCYSTTSTTSDEGLKIRNELRGSTKISQKVVKVLTFIGKKENYDQIVKRNSETSDLEVEGRKLFNAARAKDIASVTFITILESIFTTSKI